MADKAELAGQSVAGDATPSGLALEAASQPERSAGKSSLADLPLEFAESLVNSAIQEPLDGLLQLVGRPFGKDPEVHLFQAPEAKLNTLAWYFEQAGNGLGMAAPFLLLHKILGGTGSLLKMSDAADAIADKSAIMRFGLPVAKGGLAGAAYEGLLEPVNGNQNFFAARLRNAEIGGATFAALTGAALGLSRLGSTGSFAGGTLHWLTHHSATLGIMSSAPAGVVSAEATSILGDKGMASAQNVFQSAYGFAFMGGALGALHGIEGEFGSDRKAVSKPTQLPEEEQKGVNLLLTGGAVRGWGHIGVLKYLDEKGVQVDNEYGVSIGGLIASLHTNGYSGQNIQDIFLDEFHNKEVLKALPGSLRLRTFMRFKNLEPLMTYFTDKYDMHPNDDLHILSYGLRQRQPYEFSGTDYSLPRALRATAGIPGPFRWTRVESDTSQGTSSSASKMILLDGGFRRTTAQDLPEDRTVIISRLDADAQSDPAQRKDLGQRFYSRAGKVVGKLFDTNHNPDYGTDYVVSAGKPDVTSLGFALPDATYLDMVNYGYEQAKQALDGPIERGEIPLVNSDQPPEQAAATKADATSSWRRKFISIAQRLPLPLLPQEKDQAS